MRRLVGLSVLGTALLLSPTVFAQTRSTPPQPSSGDPNASEIRAATTTASGTTGLWFVPSGEVLPAGKWSASLYRTNFDDGQGFTDVSAFPATFAYGIGGRAELFGNWATVVRIDRDTRPLFFRGSTDTKVGTGGGILVDYPKVREGWIGNKRGDLTVGGKVNLLGGSTSPLAFAVRGMVKLPVGDDESGASTGKTDVQVDGIVSTYTRMAQFSGFGGVIVRGNPTGYELTNGLRWGVGAAFPQGRVRVTTELFGEQYFSDTITAPANLTGTDGSFVPTTSFLKNPLVAAVGVTFQAHNGFFVGAGGSLNLSMKGRESASCAAGITCPAFQNESGDKGGIQVRIGFHPGARNRTYVAPPPPAPPAPAPPPPPAPQNRPPTVRAACDPCTAEVGRTATISADAQDPDGDPLTYQWTGAAGTITSPTNRQSPWTAPNQVGPVAFTVTVNDGRGGTARDTVTIQVIQPAPKQYTFEDVHFEFDRYTLRPDALRVLDEAVTAMQADANLRLEIEGHTCNIGTAEYNLALGERRAQAVREYLASRGVSGDRLRTVSYGEERPKFDNAREETRRLNRRAGLVVRMQ